MNDNKVTPDLENQELREQIAQIMSDNIQFSPQVKGYVIHGAIDKIITNYISTLQKELLELKAENERHKKINAEIIASYEKALFKARSDNQTELIKFYDEQNILLEERDALKAELSEANNDNKELMKHIQTSVELMQNVVHAQNDPKGTLSALNNRVKDIESFLSKSKID